MKKKFAVLLAVITMSSIGLTAPPSASASRCFQDFAIAIEDCGGVGSFWCNADAYVDLVACVNHTVF